MDTKEILDSLIYNRDRLIVERGSDFSGVKALNTAIDIMSGKKYDKRDDPVMGYLLKEASEAPEMYNEVSRILQLLFNGRLIGAEVILICTHVALEVTKDKFEEV